jgi:arginase family enzyme
LADALHLDLDSVWAGNGLVSDRLDATDWGPKLRFSAPSRLIEQFFAEAQSRLRRFVLYGSGDFHHLTALWMRNIAAPFVLVSFDNHPDWDIRPPKWSCGAWINRALELPNVEKISVWGCGNFECWWPGQIFGNRKAERRGKLEVHPWADERPAAQRKRRGAILRTDWQARFQRFIESIDGRMVYVTIDLDCLVPNEAITNWESGRLTSDDVVWAVQKLRKSCRIAGGDLCGAYSKPRYARRKQRFAANFDHPKLLYPPADKIREINFNTLAKIWPVLVSK